MPRHSTAPSIFAPSFRGRALSSRRPGISILFGPVLRNVGIPGSLVSARARNDRCVEERRTGTTARIEGRASHDSGVHCISVSSIRRQLGAMVIASPNTKVNRFSQSPRNTRKQATSAILNAASGRGVHVRSLRYLNCHSNFTGHMIPNKPANGERVFPPKRNRICGIRANKNNGCIKQTTDGSRARRGGTSGETKCFRERSIPAPRCRSRQWRTGMCCSTSA